MSTTSIPISGPPAQNATIMNQGRFHPSRAWKVALEVLSALYGVFAVIVLLVSDPINLRTQHLAVALLVTPACISAPIGGWWAVYQCIRYERKPWRYIALIVFMPLGFVWYYFERYKTREPRQAP